jgi:prepilin-type N-terminal cleavage/methylation domain-containing protein
LNSRRGSTLIELLIAITLVSLLSVGMLFAIRVGLRTLEATNRRVLVNRRTAGSQRILELQIADFIPAKVVCGGVNAPPGNSLKTPFFQGEPNVMRFVTAYSLQEAGRGYPRVVELFIGPGQAGAGVRLLENEYMYTGPIGAGLFCALGGQEGAAGGDPIRWRPAEQSESSFVIADKLAGARFSYLLPGEGGKPDEWVPRWIKHTRWPAAVRVEMGPLDPSPDRLAPVSFTAPIRITRQPEDLR